jgi:hypothetical protein
MLITISRHQFASSRIHFKKKGRRGRDRMVVGWYITIKVWKMYNGKMVVETTFVIKSGINFSNIKNEAKKSSYFGFMIY